MFGLEKQKKKKPEDEFVFELEKELKDIVKHKEILMKVESRIQKIKEILRSGVEKEEMEQLGHILHGYLSILKVMSRVKIKK